MNMAGTDGEVVMAGRSLDANVLDVSALTFSMHLLSQLKLCCSSSEGTDKSWVSRNITAACEYLTLFPLIVLASQQKKLSKNRIWAGVSEKCHGYVPEAPGFVLITAIMFILL